jgi:hypothetical protein
MYSKGIKVNYLRFNVDKYGLEGRGLILGKGKVIGKIVPVLNKLGTIP